MNKKTVLNKEVIVENEVAKIIETTEVRYDRNQLEIQLRDIQMRKQAIKDQNKRLISEFNEVLELEAEIKSLIAKLENDDNIEVI